MNRAKYNVQLAADAITSGGTLGIFIPPSIMLILMGPVSQVFTLDLFRVAFITGALLASLYLIYTLARCWLNPKLGPILSDEDQPETSKSYGAAVALVSLSILTLCRIFGMSLSGIFGAFLPFGGLFVLATALALSYLAYRNLSVFRLLVPLTVIFHVWMSFSNSGLVLLTILGAPIYRKDAKEYFYFSYVWDEFFARLLAPIILISFALESILLGFATPAEAAAIGAFEAIFLSIAYPKFTIAVFFESMIKALEITILIMFLVTASNFFGAEFSALGTPKMMTEALLSLDLSLYVILILIMALIFLLSWPLEWVPIVLIIVHILLPRVIALDLEYFDNTYDNSV